MTDPESIAREWTDSEDLEGQLVHLRSDRARGAIHADASTPIHPLITRRMADLGVESLYRHQARAIDLVQSGADTVIVAGTASGKSLCYQVPIAGATLHDPTTTALALYPTKALARDQMRGFQRLMIPGLRVDVYDGDTTGEARRVIRRHPGVLMTNPDMLHIGILPFHGRWADFFHRLRYVVVDEMHALRGIFGTHVSMILRRLRRVARHYGADPTFILASATIGNPAELAESLIGRSVTVVDQDSSAAGERTTVLWNPPLTDDESQRRRSSLAEATDLFCDLVRRDVTTIVFARSRKAAELMFRWSRDRLPPELADRIVSYRGGYLPRQRREVESSLFSGRAAGIVTTNALELGIDVGGLEAAILTGFPGTVSSFRQQAGRAGRSKDRTLIAFVAGEDALDQYFMRHPNDLFVRPPEAVVINPSNPLIAEAHTACAAHEIPLLLDDRDILGEPIEEAANRLVQAGHLRLRDGRLVWARRRRPAPDVDIRSGGGATFSVVDRSSHDLLGTLDEARAHRDGHPGAIYLHQGETYEVETLDHELHEVRVVRSRADHYTQPKEDKDLEIVEERVGARLGNTRLVLGSLRVRSQVVAYQKRKLGTREILDTIPLDLPVAEYVTDGIWFTIDDDTIRRARVDDRHLPGSIHAAEHAGIAMMPLMAVCDRWDIGGLSTPWHPHTGRTTIFIYEAYPGGAGISPIAFERRFEHWGSTAEAIRSCPCTSGCPSCVQSPKCGNFNEPLDKAGAVRLLEALLS